MKALALALVLSACAQASPGGSIINPHCILICAVRESPVTINAEPPPPPPPAPVVVTPAPSRR